eukprot:CAMPEP_0173090570 /NCGR_PEP_ID=MMETSP1102-20130122/27024_1 /TAXON_ID=49646 /ORGANISM="Geminigera sp., Strain Caron Lab Isolate" /LENGTH=36 /DNA_ID= /DNA_START= /DNA_END= /DNA_ORIENTATION=
MRNLAFRSLCHLSGTTGPLFWGAAVERFSPTSPRAH